MFGKLRSRRRRALAMSLAMGSVVALLAVMSGSAVAAESPPENLALPTVAPTAPHQGYQVTASRGEWNSEGPSYWYDEGVKTTEGKLVGLSSPSGPISLTFRIAGLKTTVSCQAGLASAGVENPTGGGNGTGTANLSFSSCTVSRPECSLPNSAAVPVNLNLVSYNKETEISIRPQSGTTLSTWTFGGATCPFAGVPANLTGILRAPYVSKASRFEFGPDTIAGEELRFANARALEASGSIAFKTTAGHPVDADTAGYQYSWSRCFASCTPISGANQSTYTPVEADLGFSLRVSVTATNNYGTTTVDSKQTGAVTHGLSWYACESGKGTGYEDAYCSKANAKGTFSWQRIESKPVSGSGISMYIRWFVAKEISATVKCYGGSDSGTLTSGESGAKVKGFVINGQECIPWVPCELTGNALSFKPLAGATPDVATKEIKHEVSFSPESGSQVVSFNLTNCESGAKAAYEGTWEVTGSFPSQMSQTSWLQTEHTETSKTLSIRRAGFAPTYPVEMEAWLPLLSEGGNQVKLDT